jgi:hypothetical protein
MVVVPILVTSKRSPAVLVVPWPGTDITLGIQVSKFIETFKPDVGFVICVFTGPIAMVLFVWFTGEGKR